MAWSAYVISASEMDVTAMSAAEVEKVKSPKLKAQMSSNSLNFFMGREEEIKKLIFY
jgi:hypothetical protein